MIRCIFLSVLYLSLSGPAQAQTVHEVVLLTPDGAKFGTGTTVLSFDGEDDIETNTLEFKTGETGEAPLTVKQITIQTKRNGQVRTLERVTHQGHDTSRLRLEMNTQTEGHLSRWTGNRLVSQPLMAFSEDTQFGDGDDLLRDWLKTDEPQLEFLAFSFAAGGTVTLRYHKSVAIDGRIRVRKHILERGAVRSVSDLEFDASGQLIRQIEPMMGASVEIQPVLLAGTNLRSAPLSVVRNNQIKSLHRISESALRGHIRYTFSVEPGVPVQIPQTPEQRVRYKDNQIIVDVCANCLRQELSAPNEEHDGLDADLWIESDAQEIRSYVARIRRQDLTDSEKMERLIKRVRQRLQEPEFTGHYSALEAFQRRRGDCMEDALLLAAFGRAAGIPTKIVSGLVYSREKYHGRSNIFMPHAWTLAYVDGEWQSFDAALGRFDASHIALSIGDGSMLQLSASSQIASLLHWESMQGVQKPSD